MSCDVPGEGEAEWGAGPEEQEGEDDVVGGRFPTQHHPQQAVPDRADVGDLVEDFNIFIQGRAEDLKILGH